jgi:hypothetical protein
MANKNGPNRYLTLKGRQWQLAKRVPGTKKRLVVNLQTFDLLEARRKRDQILATVPRTLDDIALQLRSEGTEDALIGAGQWAEGLEPKIGTEEAVRLYKVAAGHFTPVTAYLDAFVRERPCAPTTRLARLSQ